MMYTCYFLECGPLLFTTSCDYASLWLYHLGALRAFSPIVPWSQSRRDVRINTLSGLVERSLPIYHLLHLSASSFHS